MNYMSSLGINRFLFELFSPEDSMVSTDDFYIDFWDFVKCQLEKKLLGSDYVDLLKTVEQLRAKALSSNPIGFDSVIIMKPIMLKFIETLSLLCIKAHITRKLKVELTVPKPLYLSGNFTECDDLNSDKINFISNAPYDDSVYTYLNVLKDNKIPFNISKDFNTDGVDFLYLSVYIYMYKCAKDDIIVLKERVDSECC